MQAWEEKIYDREEAREEASLLKTISLIKKNLSRGLALKDIAEFLDEDISKVQKIAGVIHQHPEADEEKLYTLLELTNDVKTEKNIKKIRTKINL